MLANGQPGEIREVEIADGLDLRASLEQVYRNGHNDVKPEDHPSVSTGDVIEHHDELYLVCANGFRSLTKSEYVRFTLTARLQRVNHPWIEKGNVS